MPAGVSGCVCVWRCVTDVLVCTCVVCRAAVGLQAGVERWSLVWRSLSTSICLLDYLGEKHILCRCGCGLTPSSLPHSPCPTKSPPRCRLAPPPFHRQCAAAARAAAAGGGRRGRHAHASSGGGARSLPGAEGGGRWAGCAAFFGGGARDVILSTSAAARAQGAKTAAGGLGVSMRAGCERRD